MWYRLDGGDFVEVKGFDAWEALRALQGAPKEDRKEVMAMVLDELSQEMERREDFLLVQLLFKMSKMVKDC